MSNASICDEILKERRRQREDLKWTLEHDDAHTNGELSRAAACYAVSEEMRGGWRGLLVNSTPGQFMRVWPWQGGFKPKGRRRDLVRAGALIVAEIARLDRMSK